jgi:hypothetical protein
MAQKAHVTSLEALETFRANLVVYLSQARPALDEVSADVLRLRMWLEQEQRLHWEGQLRRRTKEMEQAQQALFSARLGVLRKETAAEQFAVHRAKAAVAEADEKLRTIKRWTRDFDGRVQPLMKQTEKLHTVFSNDMVQALAHLAQLIKTLAAYAEAKLPSQGSTSPEPARTSREESSSNKQALDSEAVVGEDAKKP